MNAATETIVKDVPIGQCICRDRALSETCLAEKHDCGIKKGDRVVIDHEQAKHSRFQGMTGTVLKVGPKNAALSLDNDARGVRLPAYMCQVLEPTDPRYGAAKTVPDVGALVKSLRGRAAQVFHKYEHGNHGPLTVTDVAKFAVWCKRNGIAFDGDASMTMLPFGVKPDGQYDLGYQTRAFAAKVARGLGVELEGC